MQKEGGSKKIKLGQDISQYFDRRKVALTYSAICLAPLHSPLHVQSVCCHRLRRLLRTLPLLPSPAQVPKCHFTAASMDSLKVA